MSKQRWLDTRFWEDYYVSELDPIEKLLFLYFLLNSRTALCGAYEISLGIAAGETGIEKSMIKKIIDRFDNDNKLKYVDGFILIRNFGKYLNANPSVLLGIEREKKLLPQHILDIVTTYCIQPGDKLSTSCIPPVYLLKPILKLKLKPKHYRENTTITNVIVPFSNGYALWMEEWIEAMGFPITKGLKENENALKSCIADSSAEMMHSVIGYLHWLKTTKKAKERPHWFQYTTSFVKIRNFWDHIQAGMTDETYQMSKSNYGDELFNR